MTFTNEEVYEVFQLIQGNWSNDKFNGKGIYSYVDGSRYEVNIFNLLILGLMAK